MSVITTSKVYLTGYSGDTYYSGLTASTEGTPKGYVDMVIAGMSSQGFSSISYMQQSLLGTTGASSSFWFVESTYNTIKGIARELQDIDETEMGLSGSIYAESLRAMAIETGLSLGISAEKYRASVAESGLSADILAERNRAITAESGLSAFILTEANRAVATESTLGLGVSAEIYRALLAEEALLTGLSAEMLTRYNGLSAEALLRSNGDSAVLTAITAEALLRIAADVANATALTAEYSARVAAVLAEATSRSNGDSALAAAFTAYSTAVNQQLSGLTYAGVSSEYVFSSDILLNSVVGTTRYVYLSSTWRFSSDNSSFLKFEFQNNTVWTPAVQFSFSV
jgi:hypothetical protein